LGPQQRSGNSSQVSYERRFENVIGDGPSVKSVLEQIQPVALTGSTVHAQSERLKLLLDMTNTLISNLQLRDLLRAIASSIRQGMRFDAVGVFLPDLERRQLHLLALDFPEAKGPSKEDSVHPVEGTMLGRVFKTGEPAVGTPAEMKGGEECPGPQSEGIDSICALPLISRNRTLGVLALGCRHGDCFSPSDVNFLLRAAGQVAIAIENALAYREITELKDKLAQEKLYLEDEIRSEADFEGIVGQSSTLRQVLHLVEKVATSDSTVLLLGETGTGKELIARALHDRSRRKNRTLIKLNCAAIPTGLLESELFGHERGAFTGAITQKIAGWNWPIKVRCFSMKSGTSLSSFNPNSCAPCKSANLSGSAALGRKRSIFDWWPPPIAICPKWSKRISFVATSTIA